MFVGNLEPRRDFTHMSDVARALWMLLEHGQPGQVYNLGSGQAIRIGDIVTLVREQGRVPIEVEVDPTRLRPIDEPILLGDTRKLRVATGWEPRIDMISIVAELLEYWRTRITSDHQ